MMRKRKKLTASEIQVNQQFVSYTVGNSTCMPWMDYIKEIKDDCIVIYDKTRPSAGSEVKKYQRQLYLKLSCPMKNITHNIMMPPKRYLTFCPVANIWATMVITKCGMLG